MIIVFASKEPLKVPSSMIEKQSRPVKPMSRLSDDTVELFVKNPLKCVQLIIWVVSKICYRKTDSLKKRNHDPSPIAKNHNDEIRIRKLNRTNRKLPSIEVVDTKYIPNLAYFHCISKKNHDDRYVCFLVKRYKIFTRSKYE